MRVGNTDLFGKDIMQNLEELDRLARPGAFSILDMEVMVPELEKLPPGDIYLEVGVDKGKSLSVARMVCKPEVKVRIWPASPMQ